MSYFKDLSPYSYWSSNPELIAKNIGWLDINHSFKKDINHPCLEKLWQFCISPVQQTRGGIYCYFCGPTEIPYAENKGERILLGTSEIRVFSMDGSCFAAPDLIYHYIEGHHYCPPDEFISALTTGPAPKSPAYAELIEKFGIKISEPLFRNLT